MKKMFKKLTLAKVLGGIVVGLYALSLLVPFFFVVMTAFKTENELSHNPIGLPSHFSNSAYVTTDANEIKEGAGAYKNENSTNAERFLVQFNPAKDASSLKDGALRFWINIDNVSNVEGDLKVELGNDKGAEGANRQRYEWQLSAEQLQSGWNEIILPFSDGLRIGKMDFGAINSFRLTTSYGSNITMILDDVSVVEYTMTESGELEMTDNKVSLWNCDSTFLAGVSVYTKPHNFMDAVQQGNLLNALKNSVIITVGSTALVLFNVILVAYCINRIRRFKISNVLYLFFLASMFIPSVGNATLLRMRVEWGLYDNLLGEVLIGGLSITTGVFLVSGFLRTIPADLEEAARIDGANDFHVCLKVIVPVIKPVLVTVGILQFTSTWNNAMGPMMTLKDPELATLPMALLNNFTRGGAIENTKVFAGVLLTAIPIIIVFIKCQKHFITAMAGSVKG